MGLYLLHGIEDDTDEDQEGCPAEEVADRLRYAQNSADNGRQYRYEGQRERPYKGHSVHGGLEVVLRRPSLSNAGNKGSILLHIGSDLVGMKLRRRPKVGEKDD